MQNRENQTATSFAQKWSSGSTAFLSSTVDNKSEIYKWILDRNGFSDTQEFDAWLSPRKRILDAGCGNGRVTNLLIDHANPGASVVGIDLVAHAIAEKNVAHPRAKFYEADLLGDLSSFGSFDLIYCQEVLHHTNNPEKAFSNLCNLVADNGEIAIYVYKEKAVLREHSDDFIRERIQNLSLEESKETIDQITSFAQTLSKITERIDFPNIDALGIKTGETTLQRWIYNNVFKNFWNEQLSYEENFLVNFDWYHPSLASRHNLGEVLGWFETEGLKVVHALEDDYGITVRGIKNDSFQE